MSRLLRHPAETVAEFRSRLAILSDLSAEVIAAEFRGSFDPDDLREAARRHVADAGVRSLRDWPTLATHAAPWGYVRLESRLPGGAHCAAADPFAVRTYAVVVRRPSYADEPAALVELLTGTADEIEPPGREVGVRALTVPRAALTPLLLRRAA